ncbi:TetR/AcrR family transcriptional regulator [Mesorhizobium sp. Z1-4]|uniref:TetR/AcrR family transcriptional regulator n=1 Tax=Mesorhizobium sp. Z1-4 TaxID=2448478 RepID=UPI000FDC1AA2|nr:TetR/AcrR family transcriptional regulator [Mesorhizobium sp. Z1-4]
MAGTARKRDPERTEGVILRAARREFAKAGYEGARVDKIAERSKMSKGLIYHYFGSKDKLFLAVLEDIYQELREQNEALILDEFEPEQGIRRLIDHTFRYFAENPEFIVLVHSENIMRAQHLKKSDSIGKMFGPLNSRLGELIKRGVEQGLFRRDVDVTELYVSIVALGYFFLSNRHTLSIVFDQDMFAEDAIPKRQKHMEDLILGYLRHPGD